MSKRYLIVSAVIVLLLILGLGGWWYYKIYYNKFGNIMGGLAYPSEGNPAQQVCAINIRNSNFKFCTDTNSGQDKFNLKVPEGEYYVYASLKEQTGDLSPTYKAYYNQFVLCDLDIKCDDDRHHKALIPVKVENNKTVENINPYDWYDRNQLKLIK